VRVVVGPGVVVVVLLVLLVVVVVLLVVVVGVLDVDVLDVVVDVVVVVVVVLVVEVVVVLVSGAVPMAVLSPIVVSFFVSTCLFFLLGIVPLFISISLLCLLDMRPESSPSRFFFFGRDFTSSSYRFAARSNEQLVLISSSPLNSQSPNV